MRLTAEENTAVDWCTDHQLLLTNKQKVALNMKQIEVANISER